MILEILMLKWLKIGINYKKWAMLVVSMGNDSMHHTMRAIILMLPWLLVWAKSDVTILRSAHFLVSSITCSTITAFQLISAFGTISFIHCAINFIHCSTSGLFVWERLNISDALWETRNTYRYVIVHLLKCWQWCQYIYTSPVIK